MFFSSQEYTEPDVIIVFDNSYEMLEDVNDVNSAISYSNMTYSKDTVLVLMDATQSMVEKGFKAVNTARPVVQIVKPQRNLMSGMSLDRAEFGSVSTMVHDKNYFTCLRRK